MKTVKTVMITCSVTIALCLTIGGVFYAAGQAYDLNRANSQEDSSISNKPEVPRPARFNKATGIVGMDVRNHNTEWLGEIKDLVFDLKSGRVAYAVLRTGGFLEHQKLIAVPLNAFSTSLDGRYLILRTDRSRLESAQDIQRDNWPSVTYPIQDVEQFWEPSGDAISGTESSNEARERDRQQDTQHRDKSNP